MSEANLEQIGHRLATARRGYMWARYSWWRQLYIQDVADLLPLAREVERLQDENAALEQELVSARDE